MECFWVNLTVHPQLYVCTNSLVQPEAISHSESLLGAEDIVFAPLQLQGIGATSVPLSAWEQTGKQRPQEVPDMLLMRAIPP